MRDRGFDVYCTGMPLRARDAIAAADLDIPPEIVPVLEAGVAPVLAAIEALAAIDFGATEPFSPSRLVDDARGT